MMNKSKLDYELKMKGITIEHLCKKIGMSRSAYYRKRNGKSEFTLKEIENIIEELKLETPIGIFFEEKVS